jgi:hypothetical protein
MPHFALTPAPLLLYAFRYRDELTGKWMKAGYRAEFAAMSTARKVPRRKARSPSTPSSHGIGRSGGCRSSGEAG